MARKLEDEKMRRYRIQNLATRNGITIEEATAVIENENRLARKREKVAGRSKKRAQKKAEKNRIEDKNEKSPYTQRKTAAKFVQGGLPGLGKNQ